MAPTDTIEAAAQSLLQPNEAPVEDAEVVKETPPETDEAPDDDQTETEQDGEESEDADNAEEAEAADEETDEEQAEEEADADQEDQQETFTVKVDGQEVAVTLDDLKRSYSGQAYVQKGMQEAANMKKELEQHFNTLQAERNKLAEMAQQVQQGGLQPPEAPSKDLLKSDPIAYWEQRAEYDEAVAEYQGRVQQFQQMTAQQQQAEAQMRQKYLAEQAETLKQMVPEMADPQKADATRKAIMETAQNAYGFTEEELGGIVDARHVQVLNDARKWREMQAQKETVSKKAKAARPAVKPAAKRADGKKAKAKRTAERMRKSGSIDDVANFLLTDS